jgi:hypothetical protein
LHSNEIITKKTNRKPVKKLYIILDDIEKILVNELVDARMVFLPAEKERIVYRFFGLRKTVIPAKPDRWLHIIDYDRLDLYDNHFYWKTLNAIKSDTDYCLDEVTMKVYKKASIQLQMKKGNWVTYGYYDSNEEAHKVVQDLVALSKKTFV